MTTHGARALFCTIVPPQSRQARPAEDPHFRSRRETLDATLRAHHRRLTTVIGAPTLARPRSRTSRSDHLRRQHKQDCPQEGPQRGSEPGKDATANRATRPRRHLQLYLKAFNRHSSTATACRSTRPSLRRTTTTPSGTASRWSSRRDNELFSTHHPVDVIGHELTHGVTSTART